MKNTTFKIIEALLEAISEAESRDERERAE